MVKTGVRDRTLRNVVLAWFRRRNLGKKPKYVQMKHFIPSLVHHDGKNKRQNLNLDSHTGSLSTEHDSTHSVGS